MNKYLTTLLALVLIASCVPKAGLRYPPDKWMVDNDKRPISKPESRIEYNKTDSAYNYVYKGWDMAITSLDTIASTPEKYTPGGRQEALNIDNFGEVPNSSWFTNKIGRYKLKPKELAKPFDKKFAPNMNGKITILSGNNIINGEPRLYIEDSNGRFYVLKFDPKKINGVITGGEMISSIILRNAGYNVPNNYIVSLKASQLELSPKAVTRGKYAKIRKMTSKDLSLIIERINRAGNGHVRTLATEFIPGVPIGPFDFKGKLHGDLNDVIPHQHRRELRGYRVFSSFTNNLEIRDSGTLDVFIKSKPPLGYVKHNLFDLSTSFGKPWANLKLIAHNETKEEKTERKKKEQLDYGYSGAVTALFTFGIYKPEVIHSKCYDKYKGYAFLPSCKFNPGRWNTKPSNDAFYHMTKRDAFWAASIITKFSDESIREIVKLAKFPDEKFEKYTIRQLIRRRDAIGRYWFSFINPLDDFKLHHSPNGYFVNFTDLAIQSKYAKPSERRYRYMIQTRFNNIEITPWNNFENTKLFIDDSTISKLVKGKTYMLRIQTYQNGHKWPLPSVDVFIARENNDKLKILGFKRRYRN